MSFKINLNATAATPPLSVAAHLKAQPLQGARIGGEFHLVLKFPGVKEIAFSRQDLSMVIATLRQPTTEGASPGATFARSASESGDGTLTARFSDEPRARSVELSRADREETAEHLESLAGHWLEFVNIARQAEGLPPVAELANTDAAK